MNLYRIFANLKLLGRGDRHPSPFRISISSTSVLLNVEVIYIVIVNSISNDLNRSWDCCKWDSKWLNKFRLHKNRNGNDIGSL